ncbi:MAG: primosomal protein N' [Anaerolineae bacterium]|nr:primosomal protein N' [Anaerolineae bacterium]
MYTRVVVLASVSVEGREPLFDYSLPSALAGKVAVGSLLTVPFGKRWLYAVAVGLPETPAVAETRPVQSLVDPQPVLTPAQVDLARWMQHAYLAPLWRCVTLMLPPGLVGHADVEVALEEAAKPEDVRTLAQEQLFHVLDHRGPLRGRQLDRVLPRQQWRVAATQLARRKVVVKSPVLAPPRMKPKQVRTVAWVGYPADLDTALAGLKSPLYADVARVLQREPAPVEDSWVYAETGCSNYHLNKLAQRGLVAFDLEETWRDPLADETFVPDTPPSLTSDQQAVWNRILSALTNPQPTPPTFLLHGVTGSGKTEIYLRATAEMLAQGRQTIVLVPEISLTPQTAHRFGARFGRRVAVLHSALSDGERYDTWRRARAGLVDVVIGPRSALFTPLPHLGLIVLDEEHDASYKQEEIVDEGRWTRPRSEPLAPFYHARDAAIELARLTGAAVILGSATPSLQSYHRAQQGHYTLLEMPRRIMGHARRLDDLQARYQVRQTDYHPLDDGPAEARYAPLPPVQVVDMRAELQAGNRSIFSRPLERALDEALERGEQAILFLNRRGTATFVLCRDCGYVVKCPHCDVPLTYHGPRAALICHHCQHQEPPPERCPRCGRQRIRYFGLGTEQVENEVHARWPATRTLRWDHDTARDHATHAAILHLFSAGLAHVLVGTQMIAKGLDLPLVTVVGVISADTALDLPDFRAAERTFQLLEQVAGRAGRGLRAGRVVIQTYHPDHYAVRAAERHDYAGFAQQELAFRRQLDYPPYVRMARLLYRDPSASRAQAAAETMAAILRAALTREGLPHTDLIGPAPSFFAQLGGAYRWQLLLRHADPAAFLRAVDVPPGWQIDVDPVNVL